MTILPLYKVQTNELITLHDHQVFAHEFPSLIYFLTMMWYLCISLAVLALIKNANCSCNYRMSHFPPEAPVPVSNFSYTGLTGHLNWYGLSKTANVLCLTGTHQSPIDISSSSSTIIDILDY